MKLYNLKDHNEQVSFAQAVTQGLGKHQGLFFPHDLPEFSLTEIDDMLAQDFVTRSAKILSAFIGDEIPQDVLQQRVRAAFAFPAPVSKVQDDVGCLELFHGPTLAFKDFGGRFMAQMLTHIAGDKPVTILTATSGDTGAAVAHAFYGLPNVKVVILYPRGKISPLQEKLFCTLGGNIETVAIDGDFDACQALVKQAFDDEELKATLGLNNAMDVSQPNNWPRVEELFRRKIWRLSELGYAAVDDETTKAAMRELKAIGYISEPHAAIAWRALRDQLQPGEYGLFLGTAHPAKFKESVEEILQETLPLPKELADRADLPLLSHNLPADFAALRKLMMG
ncbi:MAG: threonine synthase [Klebsiella variicola]|nr:threonine synthase [Klebsiella variicola]